MSTEKPQVYKTLFGQLPYDELGYKYSHTPDWIWIQDKQDEPGELFSRWENHPAFHESPSLDGSESMLPVDRKNWSVLVFMPNTSMTVRIQTEKGNIIEHYMGGYRRDGDAYQYNAYVPCIEIGNDENPMLRARCLHKERHDWGDGRGPMIMIEEQVQFQCRPALSLAEMEFVLKHRDPRLDIVDFSSEGLAEVRNRIFQAAKGLAALDAKNE